MLGINDPSLRIIIEEKFLTSSLFSIDDFKSKFNSKCLDILNYDDYIQFVKEENSKKKRKILKRNSNILDFYYLLQIQGYGSSKSHIGKKLISKILQSAVNRILDTKNFIAIRHIERLSVDCKNLLFIFLSYSYPDILLDIIQNIEQFGFSSRMKDINVFKSRFKSYIQLIQNIKNDDPEISSDNEVLSFEQLIDNENPFNFLDAPW